jgi:hypothetical protein
VAKVEGSLEPACATQQDPISKKRKEKSGYQVIWKGNSGFQKLCTSPVVKGPTSYINVLCHFQIVMLMPGCVWCSTFCLQNPNATRLLPGL